MRHTILPSLKLASLGLCLALTTACASNQASTEQTSQKTANSADRPERPAHGKPPHGKTPHGERPSPEKIFVHMDKDSDGKLSKSEVRGPMSRHFSEIDANSDGYISKTEFENAPKPPKPPQR